MVVTRDSGVSGNKGVDGDGFWILRLDATGIKQDEWLLPGAGRDLFSTRSGFSIVTDDLEGGKIADLTISRGIRVKTKSSGTPYSVDISPDLLTWTNLLNRFNGDLELSEAIGVQNKFFRVREVEPPPVP